MNVIKESIKKRASLFILIIILVFAFWLRFNRVFQTTTYNSDVGRDYLKAYRIWQGDLTLIGPIISSVRFFLPPTYFYLISIPLKLGNWRPEIPLLIMVLLHSAGVIIYYLLGKQLRDKKTGLICAGLFAFSPYMIKAGRYTGNHLLIPLTMALYLLFLLKYFDRQKLKHLAVSSFILGLSFSLHFSIFIFVLMHLILLFYHWLFARKLPFLAVVFNLVLIFFWWLPVIVFDLRHQFLNLKGFWWFVTQGNVNKLRQQVNQGEWSITNNLRVGSKYIGQYFRLGILSWLYAPLSFIGLLIAYFYKNRKKVKRLIVLLSISCVIFLITFLLYKGRIDYHFFFAVVSFLFVLLAVGLRSILTNYLLVIIFLLLIVPYPLLSFKAHLSKEHRLPKTKQVSQKIINDLSNQDSQAKYSIFLHDNKPYWVLAKEYKFLVTSKTNRVLVKDNQYNRADVLYVVSEAGPINPLQLKNIEIKQFDPARVTWQKTIDNYHLYKLENHPDNVTMQKQ